MAKATEVPSTTKPVGKPGDERTYTRKDRSVREHPFKDQGYKGVGSKGKDGADARKVAPAPKSPFRNA